MGPCRLVPTRAGWRAKMIMRMLRKYSIAANTMHSDKVHLGPSGTPGMPMLSSWRLVPLERPETFRAQPEHWVFRAQPEHNQRTTRAPRACLWMLWPVLGPSSFWNITPCRACRACQDQAQREEALQQFKSGETSGARDGPRDLDLIRLFTRKCEISLRSVLIATDVAARGLDIKGQPETTWQVFQWIDIGLGHTGSQFCAQHETWCNFARSDHGGQLWQCQQRRRSCPSAPRLAKKRQCGDWSIFSATKWMVESV